MVPLLVKAGLALGALYLVTKGSSGSTPSTPNEMKVLADRVDQDIRAKGTGYDRALLKQFQQAAGILADGLYGPESQGMLSHHTGREAPAPIFVPQSEAPSREPLTLTEAQQAKEQAGHVEQDVRTNGMNYDREAMKDFQRLARPLYPDGKYGPSTAGALQYYTDRVPPAPLYAGKNGSKTVVPYTPPK